MYWRRGKNGKGVRYVRLDMLLGRVEMNGERGWVFTIGWICASKHAFFNNTVVDNTTHTMLLTTYHLILQSSVEDLR